MENSKEIKLDDKKRTPCEVWTRVMGYYRPISGFNAGKRSEYKDRVSFKVLEEDVGEDKI